MKYIVSVIVFCLLLPFMCISVNASEDTYSGLFEALPSEAQELLYDFGISEDVYKSYGDISPKKVFAVLGELFTGEIKAPMKTAGTVLSLIFISSLLTTLIPEKNGVSQLGKRAALMCIMFLILSTTGDVFSGLTAGVKLTENFMLSLIPVFAGIVSFSGNPSLALSFNTVVFAFAQAVTMFFENIFPVLSVLLICIISAAAINPLVQLDNVGKTVSKIVNLLMAFVAGIFVAVLSVRGVIAGAADTVTIRGVRFLVGNTLPIVGSAIGEALNSIVAGLSLIKNSVGVIGIAAVIVINLPVLIKVIIWKLSLYFIGLAGDIMGFSEVRSFSENMNSVLSVIVAALCYISFVFIISIAILLTISKG